MSEKSLLHCDRCQGRAEISATWVKITTQVRGAPNQDRSADLCPKCAALFTDFMDGDYLASETAAIRQAEDIEEAAPIPPGTVVYCELGRWPHELNEDGVPCRNPRRSQGSWKSNQMVHRAP